MFELTLLGTSSMVPTRERHPQAFYLEYKGEGLLFDCGEGCQRQMNKAGISRAKIRRIFISHWHGDHVSGLIGLIQTIGNSGYDETLYIYGPRETRERFDHMMLATIFESKIRIKVVDLEPGDEELVVVDNDEYTINCVMAEHSVPCLAYSFKQKDRVRVDMAAAKKLGLSEGPEVGKLSRGEIVEKDGKKISPKDVTYTVTGKKVTFISDTQPCENLINISRHADLVVCEATFTNEHKEKAQLFKHMTAEDAAQIASSAEAERLIITHFSQRYTSVQSHLDEAKTIFPNTEAAFDLMKIKF